MANGSVPGPCPDSPPRLRWVDLTYQTIPLPRQEKSAQDSLAGDFVGILDPDFEEPDSGRPGFDPEEATLSGKVVRLQYGEYFSSWCQAAECVAGRRAHLHGYSNDLATIPRSHRPAAGQRTAFNVESL